MPIKELSQIAGVNIHVLTLGQRANYDVFEDSEGIYRDRDNPPVLVDMSSRSEIHEKDKWKVSPTLEEKLRARFDKPAEKDAAAEGFRKVVVRGAKNGNIFETTLPGKKTDAPVQRVICVDFDTHSRPPIARQSKEQFRQTMQQFGQRLYRDLKKLGIRRITIPSFFCDSRAPAGVSPDDTLRYLMEGFLPEMETDKERVLTDVYFTNSAVDDKFLVAEALRRDTPPPLPVRAESPPIAPAPPKAPPLSAPPKAHVNSSASEKKAPGKLPAGRLRALESAFSGKKDDTESKVKPNAEEGPVARAKRMLMEGRSVKGTVFTPPLSHDQDDIIVRQMRGYLRSRYEDYKKRYSADRNIGQISALMASTEPLVIFPNSTRLNVATRPSDIIANYNNFLGVANKQIGAGKEVFILTNNGVHWEFDKAVLDPTTRVLSGSEHFRASGAYNGCASFTVIGIIAKSERLRNSQLVQRFVRLVNPEANFSSEQSFLDSIPKNRAREFLWLAAQENLAMRGVREDEVARIRGNILGLGFINDTSIKPALDALGIQYLDHASFFDHTLDGDMLSPAAYFQNISSSADASRRAQENVVQEFLESILGEGEKFDQQAMERDMDRNVGFLVQAIQTIDDDLSPPVAPTAKAAKAPLPPAHQGAPLPPPAGAPPPPPLVNQGAGAPPPPPLVNQGAGAPPPPVQGANPINRQGFFDQRSNQTNLVLMDYEVRAGGVVMLKFKNPDGTITEQQLPPDTKWRINPANNDFEINEGAIRNYWKGYYSDTTAAKPSPNEITLLSVMALSAAKAHAR